MNMISNCRKGDRGWVSFATKNHILQQSLKEMVGDFLRLGNRIKLLELPPGIARSRRTDAKIIFGVYSWQAEGLFHSKIFDGRGVKYHVSWSTQIWLYHW